MHEVLLGFHLRVPADELESWDSPRRETYLLREDILRPLSVDRAVWPLCTAERLLSLAFIDYSSEPYTSPNGLGLYSVRDSRILSQPSCLDGCILVGVTVVSEDSCIANGLKSKHGIADNSFSIEELVAAGWSCVGYEVANDWLLSGLMNCGYQSSEKPALSVRYGSSLNECGLFRTVEMVEEFRVNCDARVPEHTPFAVYGIWTKGDPCIEPAE